MPPRKRAPAKAAAGWSDVSTFVAPLDAGELLEDEHPAVKRANAEQAAAMRVGMTGETVPDAPRTVSSAQRTKGRP